MTAARLDDGSFAELTEPRRRELHVHCYRMLASFDEAEDAVQETFLRAWKARAAFDGSTGLRAWLYRIATNVCLDLLRVRSRRGSATSYADLPWLQPYPDRLLDELDELAPPAPADDEPEAVAVSRETISLAFLAALQVLPARQRAALIARDVLGWPAAETAALLETSVAATNSALQRARATMQDTLPPRRAEWIAAPASPQERALLDRFMDAHERCDVTAAIAIAAEDIRVTMPPYPYLFDGITAVSGLLRRGLVDEPAGDWRLVPTSANRMPTAASYLQRPGDTEFRAFKFDVLCVLGGRIAEITTFGPEQFPAFGLPMVLGHP